jgi:glycosyltransferase involved in cell wall biosynthesis
MSAARALRVGVDARSWLQKHPRGEGKTLYQLYRHIQAQHPDWQITFFGDQRTAEASLPTLPGIAVRHMVLPGDRFDSWENVCLPLMAARARCDVLHCASSSGPWWSPAPVVLTVHDLIPVVADDGVDEAFQQAFLKRLRRGLRRARQVIAVSENTRRDLLRVLPGVGPAPEVVHWGATPNLGAPVAPPTPRPEPPYLIAFGGEAPRKNSDYVLDRFIAVARRVPDLQLLLVGVSGQRERQRHTQRMAAAGLAERLRMPGFVGDDELDQMLRRARALFYPSLYEGFGMPLLEAVERGLPAVASNLSSIPEVLQGVPGCHDLADIAGIEDALAALASDDAVRATWVAAQKTVLERFSWDRTARQTAELLRRAAG